MNKKRLKRGKEYNMSPGAIRKREARKREKERLNSEKARRYLHEELHDRTTKENTERNGQFTSERTGY